MAKIENMFGGRGNGVKKADPHPRRETKWLHYTKLTDNRSQYRESPSMEDIKALAALIDAEQCVIQNLLVRQIDTDSYEIIAGHHRKKACAYLVEERGLKEYEFLPCTVETLDDVRSEFQVYSSNGFVPKTDYEKMYELQRMKYLIEHYPEEFPHLQTGRMVERLAKQMHMSKTAAGEYLTISKNLGEKGMEAFKEGTLKKSAALEMASLPEDEQEQLIDQGITMQKDIQGYKKKKICPSDTVEKAVVADERISPSKLSQADKQGDVPEKVKPEETEEEEEAEEEEYTREFFFNEQKDILHVMMKDLEKGKAIPKIEIERQKIIVIALMKLVMEVPEECMDQHEYMNFIRSMKKGKNHEKTE